MFDLKKTAKGAGAVVAFLAASAGAVVAVDSRYAHAGDVRTILESQKKQLELYQQHQREVQLFQVDVYSSRIKQLEDEKRKAQFVHSTPSVSATTKALTRTPTDIDNEIVDLKKRKEFVEKNIVGR